MGEGEEVLMSREARGLLGEVDIVGTGGLVGVGVVVCGWMERGGWLWYL